jgi:hypothetical protein
MEAYRLKRVLILALASFALLHVWTFWRLHDSIFRGYGDFASFYTAGKIVQQGESARLYDRGLQWQVQQEFASSVTIRSGPLPYIRPPFEALLFLPFAYMNYPFAFMVWTAIKIVMLFAVSFLLFRENDADSGLLPKPFFQGLLFLGFFPVAFDLVQGQDSILLLLVLTLVFRSFRSGSDFRSGAYLGLGLFKFHLIVPLFLVLLLKRRTRATLGFLCAASVLLLVSVGLVGWSGVAGYPRYLWDLKEAPTLAGMKAQTMPNIRGLLTPFLGQGRVPLPLQGALVAVSLLGVLTMARTWRADNDSRVKRMGFSFCIVVTLLTSYYTNSYDLTLLILPLLLAGGIVASHPNISGWPRMLFMTSGLLLLLSPLYWILALSFDEFYWMAVVLLAFALSLAATAESCRCASPELTSRAQKP